MNRHTELNFFIFLTLTISPFVQGMQQPIDVGPVEGNYSLKLTKVGEELFITLTPQKESSITFPDGRRSGLELLLPAHIFIICLPHDNSWFFLTNFLQAFHAGKEHGHLSVDASALTEQRNTLLEQLKEQQFAMQETLSTYFRGDIDFQEKNNSISGTVRQVLLEGRTECCYCLFPQTKEDIA